MNQPAPADPSEGLTRGSFMKSALGVAVGGAAGSLLSACAGLGAKRATGSALPPATGPVRRGGQLRVGMVGGGSSETFDPARGVTIIDQARIDNVFEPLTLVAPDLSLKPGLALEWNANQDATVYEIKLRPDVTFHNGKSFTADDVIYSMQQMGKATSAGAPFVAGVRLGELKKINDLTVRVPLKYADAYLSQNFVFYNTNIIQDGETNFAKPVGTGPFVFESFTPGSQSTITAYKDYWEHGKPYVDSVTIISITDDTARLNALLANEIDAMAQLSFDLALAQQNSSKIVILNAPGPQPIMFYMDVSRPPFNDPRVRMAMRLIPDRPALIDGALAGYGTLGNDIIGKGLEFYDSSLPQREQDIDHAKFLLKQAGRSDLQFTLDTSTLFPGFVESATLLAEQASHAGVKINLRQIDPDAYYNTSLDYLKMGFAETQWQLPSLKYFYLQALSSSAPYNETHWSSKSFDKQLLAAIGEQDRTEAARLWTDLQRTQYELGGYINWAQYNWLDGLSPKVRGIVPSAYSSLGNGMFKDAWLAA
ncbi:MAG: ABC transporter substrate-binding protein [Solirubrobacteraceae bacterium]